MATRVAWVAILSAALGGLTAALVVTLTVDRLLQGHADRTLKGMAIELAEELDEEPPTVRKATLPEELADENGELAAAGIRLAVFEQGQRIAGDPAVPRVRAGACRTKGVLGERTRACGFDYHSWVLVAAQPSDTAGLRWAYLFAALGAMLLGAGGGAVTSRRLTRWAVHPLQRLGDALRRSSPKGSIPLELGSPSDCEEVEQVRVVLSGLSQEIQDLVAQARRFAADAAHELRTPLTALVAELELLAETQSAEERVTLDRTCARARRLSELVERLLVLTMPEERLSEGFETLSLADILEETTRELTLPERARVTVESKTEGLMRGDAQLLRSLVHNALTNALKFGPEGPVVLSLAEPADAAQVVLQVQDQGPGISPELRDKVFVPHFRAQPRLAKGYGLGLALIGHIARVHGGKAEFVDCPKGACLRVAIPAWAPS